MITTTRSIYWTSRCCLLQFISNKFNHLNYVYKYLFPWYFSLMTSLFAQQYFSFCFYIAAFSMLFCFLSLIVNNRNDWLYNHILDLNSVNISCTRINVAVTSCGVVLYLDAIYWLQVFSNNNKVHSISLINKYDPDRNQLLATVLICKINARIWNRMCWLYCKLPHTR